MAKAKKSDRRVGISPEEKNREKKLPVDEAGDLIVSDDDPDIIPTPEEDLETTPPYEPPPPAEGP